MDVKTADNFTSFGSLVLSNVSITSNDDRLMPHDFHACICVQSRWWVVLRGDDICILKTALLWLQNPVILLCDEATSALDSRTEKQILQALQALARGRTSLFVAHRLSTAAQCDQIVVLEGVRCHPTAIPAPKPRA